MARIPRVKKRVIYIAAGLVLIGILAALFLFHMLPSPGSIGHFVEPKAATIQPSVSGNSTNRLGILMNPPLVADFSSEPDTDYSPLTIRFFDMSRGSPGSRAWDFGDGTTSSDQSPVHIYRQPGLYNVTLVVTRDDGSRRVSHHEDVLRTLLPAEQPVQADTLRQGSLVKGSSVTFLSTDDSSFCTFNGARQVIPAGSYAKIRLNSDDNGMISIRNGNLFRFEFTDAILIINGTQVSQGASGDCIIPQPRYFHANLTFFIVPTQGPIRRMITNGREIRSGSDNSRILIIHDSTDRNADLTLVTWPAYFEGSATAVSLSSDMVAGFSVSQKEGDAPLNISFRDLSAGNPGSWAWDFGDGSRSSEQNPVHLYQSPGSYTVSLSITNGNQTDSITKRNEIVAFPPRIKADFEAFPLKGPVPLKVTFTDKSINSPRQWTWGIMTNDSAFGTRDGAVSSSWQFVHEQNPVITFREPGVYSVWLAVNNIYGMSEIVRSGYITVTDPYRSPVQDISIQTGKKGVIKKDSSLQFVVSDSPATIGINGGYRELQKGTLVLIQAESDQGGEITIDKGQLLKFSFPDVSLYVDGDYIGRGEIRSIYIPHMTDFRTALTYYLPPASAYTTVTMDGYNVLSDLETAWIEVDNLGMDESGNLRLASSENVTYLNGAANKTVHGWIVW